MTVIFLLTGKNPHEIEYEENKPDYKKYTDIPEHFSALLDMMTEPNPQKRKYSDRYK